jgi:hypothetical protein
VARRTPELRAVEDRLQQASPLVRRGYREEVLDELRRDADGGEGGEWTVGVDAGVVRAHQHAAGARHQPPADIDADVLVVRELAVGARAALAFVEYPNSPEARPPPRTC